MSQYWRYFVRQNTLTLAFTLRFLMSTLLPQTLNETNCAQALLFELTGYMPLVEGSLSGTTIADQDAHNVGMSPLGVKWRCQELRSVAITSSESVLIVLFIAENFVCTYELRHDKTSKATIPPKNCSLIWKNYDFVVYPQSKSSSILPCCLLLSCRN